MDQEACDILSNSTRLHDPLHRWSQSSPDQPALLEADEAWTYRELELVVAKTATWLVAAGVRPGDRVMIVFENCKSFVAILFALSQINALCVPVNARLSGRELDTIRDHCGARLIVYLTSVSSHALDHAKRSGAAMEEHKDLGLIGLSALEEAAVPETPSPDSADAVAAIIYTSGTTSKPKGVMLTHRNVLFSATAAGKLRFLTPADRVLGILPMSHATGLVVQVLGSLFHGGAVYLLPQFDPIKVSAVLQKYSLTVLYGVPFVFTQFLEYAKIRGIKSFRYPRLRVMSCSGAPLLPAVK